jgi:subtilase family protein
MGESRRYRLFLLGAAAVALAAGLALPGGAAASVTADNSVTSGNSVTPGAGTGPLAPAADGAAGGGPVIVVLKSQFSGVNLRTQAASRAADASAAQSPVAADITAHGGTNVSRLVAPDAIAAKLPAAEVSRLRANPAVAEIVPDVPVTILGADDQTTATPATAQADAQAMITKPAAATTANRAAGGGGACPFNPAGTSRPLQEPEADTDIHASTGNPNAPDMGNSIATGQGVIVANDGMNQLAGNPNFTRPDGTHVVIDAPDYSADHSNDEDYGDASTIAAQGTVDYQYSGALPYSDVPAGCEFDIKGDAPGVSLVDLSQVDTPVLMLSQVVAGIDNAVSTVHADVISESFGTSALPTSTSGKLLAQANEAAVAAGVTVVESSGDSGSQGTMIAAADDPAVIAAGAVDNFRLVALAHDYKGYVSNNMAALSSGGTAPTGKVVDLVAPGYFGGEAACADGSGGCPPNYPTESMRGTSESAPLIAGAAADVIQAYRATHGGASPSPALIKQILTSTATDLGNPADQQGAGLLNVYAAVKAAQQLPGTTDTAGPGNSPALISDPSQVDLTSQGDPFRTTNVSLYNTSTRATTVTSDYRWLGPERQLGKTVTEQVSAPPAGTAIPPEGAAAAPTISFTVPGGLDRLDADMIWPDPTNDNIICFALFDPRGRLAQLSYDDGSAGANGASGSVPDIQDAQVTNPEPGRWTAKILWSGKDVDLALPPATPGGYTGPVSFKVSGQNFETAPAARPVTIPAHSSATIPLRIAFPSAPGDHPESVQFTATDGARASVPIARRTLIPSGGGSFDTLITSTVGRMIGQQNTYEITVPAGRSALNVSFRTQDASPDNKYTFYLVSPSGTVAATATSPQTVNGVPTGTASLSAADPAAGTWQVQVVLNLTVSGKEFLQTVYGEAAVP